MRVAVRVGARGAGDAFAGEFLGDVEQPAPGDELREDPLRHQRVRRMRDQPPQALAVRRLGGVGVRTGIHQLIPVRRAPAQVAALGRGDGGHGRPDADRTADLRHPQRHPEVAPESSSPSGTAPPFHPAFSWARPSPAAISPRAEKVRPPREYSGELTTTLPLTREVAVNDALVPSGGDGTGFGRGFNDFGIAVIAAGLVMASILGRSPCSGRSSSSGSSWAPCSSTRWGGGVTDSRRRIESGCGSATWRRPRRSGSIRPWACRATRASPSSSCTTR